MPKLLISTTKGIYLLIFLILQIIRGLPFSYFTANLKTAGKAAIPFGSDLISVTHGSCSILLLKVYTKLQAIRSWPTTTFSEPLMMKQPPWSQGHSPISMRSSLSASLSLHQLDLTMTGMLANSILGIYFLDLRVSSPLREFTEERLYCRSIFIKLS